MQKIMKMPSYYPIALLVSGIIFSFYQLVQKKCCKKENSFWIFFNALFTWCMQFTVENTESGQTFSSHISKFNAQLSFINYLNQKCVWTQPGVFNAYTFHSTIYDYLNKIIILLLRTMTSTFIYVNILLEVQSIDIKTEIG